MDETQSQAKHPLSEKSRLLDILLKKRGIQVSQAQEITRRPAAAGDVLSFAQQWMWFLYRLQPESPVYNISAAVRLKGELEVAALVESLNEIVRRHEILRTTFSAVDGEPVPVVSAPGPLNVRFVDLRQPPGGEPAARAEQLALEEAREPFDLTRGPLLRVTLLRLAEDEHEMLLTMHHIISDGWSAGVIVREAAALYEAALRGTPSPLPELPIQYADYAYWQRRWLREGVLASQLPYWRRQLAGAPPLLALPTDRPRPAVQTFDGATYSFTLQTDASRMLELAREEDATTFMVLLSAFKVLLYRYSRQEDVVVGSPISNRRRVETEGLIGFFVNMLVYRTSLAGNPTFRELLRRVREVSLGAYSNQDVPFGKLVEELRAGHDLSHTPLFQVAFTFQNFPQDELKLPGLKLQARQTANGTAKFDLRLEIAEEQGRLGATLEYNTGLFDEATIRRMAGHFETLLAAAVADAGQPIAALPMLSEGERRQLLVEWNHNRTDYPRDACIHHLFEAQAERTPEAVALVFGDERVTYRELNARSNQLAHYLRWLGVRQDDPVGLCLHRSAELIVAMLAVLKAGGAYVPLDPSYPSERLSFMLSDLGVSLLLTEEELREGLPAIWPEPVCLDERRESINAEGTDNPPRATTADGAAYVMYTSGSTGRPKGVVVPHRAVVRLVKETNYFEVGAGEVFLQLAPVSFDASTFEIWGCLLNGSRLVLAGEPAPTPQELTRIIARHRVTTLWLTAGLFHVAAEEVAAGLRGLRQLLAGGDVLAPAHVRRVLREAGDIRLINGYGPTENTTFTCCYPAADEGRVGASIPIGRPVSNTSVYLLDAELRPVPVGVPGELYAGGDGLARGYFNRPGATAESFIPDPFSAEPGARLYRTGDLARYLPDGNIEFLGRVDRQVKVRGFRVEPGEVEAALKAHGGLREAVVVAREAAPGDKRLVAYFVPASASPPTVSQLRDFLKQSLPEYMLPSFFISLDGLPLTPNGKVDLDALPAPDGDRPESGQVYVAPRTALEEVLAGMWALVLDAERVGIHDSFFDLGGHSLLATQLLTRIAETFQVDLPLSAIFEAPDVASFAELMRRGESHPGGFEKIAQLLKGLEHLSDSEAAELLSAEGAAAADDGRVLDSRRV